MTRSAPSPRGARAVICAASACAALALTLATAACAARTTSGAAGRPQTGVASWYGPRFHGRTTANGERYNMLDLTAAHKTLPFGTLVLVTNRDTKRSIVVRINDRGPFVRGRIIDLSYAAAKVLGASTTGVVPVQVRVVDRARGEALLEAQRRLIGETGLRPWTESDYRRLEAWSRPAV
jgi:rare lipoprotein A